MTDWTGFAFPKGQTRLQEHTTVRKLTQVDEKAFKAAVWKRDRSRCRWCGRKVQKVLGRVPDRGEVHHIHGRAGELRFDDRCALLLCLTDHERVTGRVNEKVLIVPTRHLSIRGELYIDARYPVRFKEL